MLGSDLVALGARPPSRAGVLGAVTAGAAVLSCGVQVILDRELMMRVFVAGATGAIGKHLVPRLVAAGHEVHGMTRSEAKQEMLYELGAVPVVADALDPDQVAEAVGRARPDVIVRELTAIGDVDTRHMERSFAPTSRLGTEGTDHLLSAGQAVGVRRFVAQSHIACCASSRWSATVARCGPSSTSPTPRGRPPHSSWRQGLTAG
jgi:nucleoside-diphosphate-sugar epimerase